ncbi:putative transcriptional regulatory protein [Colletotrichum gloeosporioides]|uniref:Putative transcriptional regulatory protein n=1 Tax=Colletotrichum gloeosporioides TaxID=474922 RepID=A0A8H4FDL0_COLGL|nr:putative transcriptional regulatory protein [Colletotrichum gloeosporioides]KAF3798467.1 putative transcriptional regulatory protein [Colletotrichum gloeosporioides]
MLAMRFSRLPRRFATSSDSHIRRRLEGENYGIADFHDSAVQYLEQKLAELEAFATTREGVTNAALPTQDNLSINTVEKDVQQIAGISVIRSLSASGFECSDKIQHKAKLFYGSERPPLKIPIGGIYHELSPRTAGHAYASQFAKFNARRLPKHVAKRLFENYKMDILPRFPCFEEDEIGKYFNLFYEQELPKTNEESLPDIADFVVPMVLAICSLTSRTNDFEKVAALSEALQSDALRDTERVLQHASIQSLKCLLLIIQLALLLPHTANLWHSTGEAMRVAVSLGLHQEPDDRIMRDHKLCEERRKLFWVIYQLDRIVSISAGCPVALGDEHITTQLPFGGGSPFHGGPDENHSGIIESLTKRRFLMRTRACVLQSEIHATQFFDQALPDSVKDHADWINKTNEAVQRLANEATPGPLVDPWLISVPYQCRVLLHRPCSRNIVVSDESLLAVVIAATNLIALDMNVAKAGGLVMAFEIANRDFQAGMVLLYALRNHSAKLEEASFTAAAERALSDLVQLFKLLSSRWPPLADTAAYINELIDTNLRNPVGHSGSAYDMNVLEELDCLVTQRRIHSIRHRNVVLPQQKKPAAAATQPKDCGQQMGEDLFDDENWWRDFINDDLVTNDSPFSLISPDAVQSSVSIHPHERIQHPPDPRQDLSDLEKQLQPIIEALPSCSFCRDRRIKCRLQLPACKECHRTSRNCVVYDPILGSNVPLKRIHSLLEQIRHKASTSLPAPTFQTNEEHLRRRTMGVLLPVRPGPQEEPLSSYSQRNHSDSFFGTRSAFGCLRNLLQKRPVTIPEILRTATHWNSHNVSPTRLPWNGDITKPLAEGLFQLFNRSANAFFPVLESSTLDRIVTGFFDFSRSQPSTDAELFYLVVAIASSVGTKSDPRLVVWAESSYAKAIEVLHTDCDHGSRPSNVLLFERTLLICIYLLLNPQAGDIWRHLGFAIRHYLDLSHRPSTEELDEGHDLFCTLTRTLYCLESQVSIAFGRPSLLAIGDGLRKELTNQTTGTIREQISVSSYLIAFLKMKIHNTLLANDANSLKVKKDDLQRACQEHRRVLDEWFVRWKERMNSVPEVAREPYAGLISWVKFSYHHGIFMISLLWPTAGGHAARVCSALSDAGLQLTRQQQLFGRLFSVFQDDAPILVFPISWVTSHTVFQVGLSTIDSNSKSSTQEGIGARSTALQRCLSLVLQLEADSTNLLTGQSVVLQELISN